GEEEPKMPMAPVAPLTSEEIAAVKEWINAGAPMTDSPKPTGAVSKTDDGSLLVYGSYRERQVTEADREWWAFKKPASGQAPRVSDARWSKNPVDAFVRAKQEEKGLKAAPVADRNTLIRRAYLDLIGILPTPAEV